MTANNIPRQASTTPGEAITGDDEADLERLDAETRRPNAEADLLWAMNRKRRAEEMLNGRPWALADVLTGMLLAAGVIGLTAAAVRFLP